MDRLKSNFPYDLLGKSFLMLYPYITLFPKLLYPQRIQITGENSTPVSIRKKIALRYARLFLFLIS